MVNMIQVAGTDDGVDGLVPGTVSSAESRLIFIQLQ